MLAAGLAEARHLGLDRVLLTCDVDNEPSRRVILANGGVPDGRSGHDDRFWIDLSTNTTNPASTSSLSRNASQGRPA
jgi:RimJ/RimL family protein N-acetyltransferase